MSLDLELGFRKSEILEIIQQFDSSFSFDANTPVIQMPSKEYPLIYKNDYFDLAECESIITGYDPSDNWQCSERDQAYRLINSSLNNGLFERDENNNYFISADNFKEWLQSKDIFIEGFNDNLPPVTANKIEHTTISQTDSQLSQQVADLKAQLASATDTIASLQEKLQQSNFDRLESYNFNTAELHRAKTESNQYQKENESLKAKIAELEAGKDTQSDTPAEKILHSRTANNASKIISALASELLGMDLTQPYADNTNGRILKAIERQGNTLSKDTIADWLRQAHEISK